MISGPLKVVGRQGRTIRGLSRRRLIGKIPLRGGSRGLRGRLLQLDLQLDDLRLIGRQLIGELRVFGLRLAQVRRLLLVMEEESRDGREHAENEQIFHRSDNTLPAAGARINFPRVDIFRSSLLSVGRGCKRETIVCPPSNCFPWPRAPREGL